MIYSIFKQVICVVSHYTLCVFKITLTYSQNNVQKNSSFKMHQQVIVSLILKTKELFKKQHVGIKY